jgi:hypothetical protein
MSHISISVTIFRTFVEREFIMFLNDVVKCVILKADQGEVLIVNKSFVILDIYNLLIKREPFSVDSICRKYNISRRTTLRYVKVVKDFILEYYTGYSVNFDKIEGTYRLIQG